MQPSIYVVDPIYILKIALTQMAATLVYSFNVESSVTY